MSSSDSDSSSDYSPPTRRYYSSSDDSDSSAGYSPPARVSYSSDAASSSDEASSSHAASSSQIVNSNSDSHSDDNNASSRPSHSNSQGHDSQQDAAASSSLNSSDGSDHELSSDSEMQGAQRRSKEDTDDGKSNSNSEVPHQAPNNRIDQHDGIPRDGLENSDIEPLYQLDPTESYENRDAFDVTESPIDRYRLTIVSTLENKMLVPPIIAETLVGGVNHSINQPESTSNEVSWPVQLIAKAKSEILPVTEIAHVPASEDEAVEYDQVYPQDEEMKPGGEIEEPESQVIDGAVCFELACLPFGFTIQMRRTSEHPLYRRLVGMSEIRLLYIENGTRDEPLVCSLRHHDLQDTSLRFEALSYRWGTEKSDSPLHCHGRGQRIQLSLDSALRRLRLQDRTRILWVDAICISQDDDTEKEHQIQLMRQIYKQASRVLIWIDGHDLYRSRKAFMSLSGVVAYWFKSKTKYDVGLGYYMPMPSSIPSDSWDSIVYLFSREYWRRLWVVQEVVCSSKALVLWEDKEIAWTWIGLAATIIRNNGDLLDRFQERSRETNLTEATQGLMNAYVMYRLSQTDFDTASLPFLDLIRLTLNFNVTHPLDRIYAILGLPSQHTSDQAASFIVPNYSLSKEQLYINLALKILETHTKPLELLSAVYHEPKASRFMKLQAASSIDSSFPSWVPRWDRNPIRSISGSHRPSQRFSASLGYCTGISFSIVRKPSHPILLVSGLVIDTISTKYPSNTLLTTDAKPQANLLDWFLDLGLLSAELFAFTITAGQDWYGKPLQTNKEVGAHLADFIDFSIPHWGLANLEKLKKRDDLVVPNAGNGARFLTAVRNVCRGRNVFSSVKKSLVLGPQAAREGDLVCVFFGARVPFVVRPLRNGAYQLVGECYLHRSMLGEAIGRWQRGEYDAEEGYGLRDFKLV